ncbi:MAG: endonuclease Q family protein [Patescibacteria group bacterium]
MKFIADFHIHSKYSRATSKDMTLEMLNKWAKIKGVQVLGTGDFTHPAWLKELKEKLEPLDNGLFKLKNDLPAPASPAGGDEAGADGFFILTAEISCIYSKNGRVRKVHMLILAPSFSAVEKINTRLALIGNLKADGRPILGLDAKELTKIVLDASPECLAVPGHIWTPWFSVFGSKSGFDSLEECFEEYTKYIYAGETGLSSDPAMNWRWSELDKIALISNSDAHSPQKIGREANVFDTEISYPAISQAIKDKDPSKFLFTIEFFPEEGKYHFDGHRACKIRCSPEQAKKYNNICPNCGRPLTLGVLHRVDDLADRQENERPASAIPFRNLIPLREIIGEAFGVGPASKRVGEEYERIIAKAGSELEILLETPEQDLLLSALPRVVEGIIKVRQGNVSIDPGYDGVYGKINIFLQVPPSGAQATPSGDSQNTLF